MKRKQSCSMLTGQMIDTEFYRLAEGFRSMASWFGKVVIMTAVLALVGVLAGPDLGANAARADIALSRHSTEL